MTYPTFDKEVQLKQEKADRAYKEAEIYIDADSFEEFELKRSIVGINYNFFLDDVFKIYYVFNNKYRLIYTNEDGICFMLTVLGMSCIVLAMIMSAMLLLLGAGVCVMILLLYLKSMSMCRYAQNMIDKVNWNRELKSKKSHASVLSSSAFYPKSSYASYASLSC